MILKAMVIFCLALNFLVLMKVYKDTGNYRAKPKSKLFFNTKGWENYLELYEYNEDEANIITDHDYCNKVKRLNHDLDLEDKNNRVIFSDYRPGNLVKEVFSAYGQLVHPDHHIDTDENDTYTHLDPTITLFYHKSSWHNNQMIGAGFLCEGQRYNHIPGNVHMGYKDLMVKNLKKYSKFNPRCFAFKDFMPDTYDLTEPEDCLEISKILNPSDEVNWILKKSRNSHNAEGVQILQRKNTIKVLNAIEYGEKCGRFRDRYLIQKYIKNPLLINGHKFDFRVYMLIANVDPLIVLYHEGFLRVTLGAYNISSSDPAGHITNTALAKEFLERQNYTAEVKQEFLNEQMWTYSEFLDYLISVHKVEDVSWLYDYLVPQMKTKMLHIVRSVYQELLPHPGVFELFGVDFLLDDDLNVWFLEVVKSPAMLATTQQKGVLMKRMVKELLDIEYGLLMKKDIEEIVKETEFEFVYNGLKKCPDCFCGVLEEDCVEDIYEEDW